MAASSSAPSADPQLPEELLKLTDDITISDLLLYPGVTHLAVRFICGVRKLMTTTEPPSDPDLIKTESLVARAYFALGPDLREQAFQQSPYRTGQTPPPAAMQRAASPSTPEPATQHAPALDVASTTSLAMEIIHAYRRDNRQTFHFAEIQQEFERRHTQDGALPMAAIDLTLQGSGIRWMQLLSIAMLKLRESDVISYRATKNDYFILPL